MGSLISLRGWRPQLHCVLRFRRQWCFFFVFPCCPCRSCDCRICTNWFSSWSRNHWLGDQVWKQNYIMLVISKADEHECFIVSRTAHKQWIESMKEGMMNGSVSPPSFHMSHFWANPALSYLFFDPFSQLCYELNLPWNTSTILNVNDTNYNAACLFQSKLFKCFRKTNLLVYFWVTAVATLQPWGCQD